MKIRIVPLLLAISFTIFSLIIAFFFSLWQPYYVREDMTLGCVILLNFWWVLYYSIKFYERKDKSGFSQVVIIYLLMIGLAVFFKFYRRPFNAVKWKREIFVNTPDSPPMHMNGNMLPDLIDSKVLIGQSVKKVKEILGMKYYIPGTPPPGNDFTMLYWYTGTADNCDRLYVEIKNGFCTKVDVVGCD